MKIYTNKSTSPLLGLVRVVVLAAGLAALAACGSGTASTSGGLPKLTDAAVEPSVLPAPAVPVENVTLNYGKPSISMVMGASKTLVASITPADASNQNLIWKSSDPSVASVSDSGVVTALQAGVTTITAVTADGKKEAIITVTVERYSLVERAGGGTYDKTDCVKDNGNGLIWEGKEAGNGARGKDAFYRNYDDINSPQFFDIDLLYINPTQAQIDAPTNSIAYVKTVKAAALCGFTDWRRPTKEELLTLVQGKTSPTIDSTWFPNTLGTAYLTSSAVSGVGNQVWIVSFNSGEAGVYDRNDSARVRLVRSSK